MGFNHFDEKGNAVMVDISGKVTQQDGKTLPKGEERERPLYKHISIHLAKIRFNGNDAGIPEIGETEIFAPLPKSFSACLKKIGFEPNSY